MKTVRRFFSVLFVLALIALLDFYCPTDASAQCNVSRNSASASASSAADLQNQALASQLAQLQQQLQAASARVAQVEQRRLFSQPATSTATASSATSTASAVPQPSPDFTALLAALQATQQTSSSVQASACSNGNCGGGSGILARARSRGLRPRLFGARTVSLSRSVSISR